MERLNGTLKQSGNLTGEEIPVIIKEKTVVEKDYENLDNKPSINDVILDGNKTPEELGLTKASDFELYKQSVNHSFRGVSESIQSVKTESKTYTDDTIAAAKAYSDEKNSDLETAINNTINNKNNATRAYASHLVSEERGARETADEETLTTSKSYTDTAVVKEITKGPASSLEFEGLQEGIPFPKIILTVPDEYVYEEGKTAHSINICCNNNADPDATELYSENMLVVAKSNTVEIGYDDAIKLLKQVPGKCIVGFSNEEDAAVCTLTVTGALKYEALKRIYSECWNRMDVEKDDMEGYVRGYTDTEITKCKEYTDEKIAEVSGGSDITSSGNLVQLDGLQGGVPFSAIMVSGKNLTGNTIISTTGEPVIATNTDSWSIEWTTGFGIRLSNVKVEMNKDYTVKYSQKSENRNDSVRIMIINSDTGNTVSEQNTANVLTGDEYTDNTFTFNSGTANHIYIRFVRATSTGKATLSKMIQLEVGSVATEYEPPITGRELTVSVCGKNLLKYPYAQTTRTSYGITFTDNGDGSITASGTHDGGTKLSYFGFSPWWASPNGGRLFLQKGNTVTFRVIGLTNTYQCMLSVKKDNTSVDAITAIYAVGESAANYTAEQDCYIAFGIYGLKSSIGQDANFTVYPQLELGDTATEYEPYHGSTTTITPDSNPYVIPNDIRQQDGLNNISVSEGKISVVGVRKNAAIKRIWEKLDELTTSISYTDEKIGNINTILESVTGGAE